MRMLGMLVVIFAGVYGVWWVTSRNSNPVPAPPTPNQVFKAQPSQLHETVSVPAGKQQQLTWTPPANLTSGVLQGRWRSAGKSAGIRGATDDTLISFKLIGPSNNVIQQQSDHPLSGNFSVRIEGPGNVTFIFDNGGIVRSSVRQVEIQGTYQPD